MDARQPISIQLAPSDPAQAGALARWLAEHGGIRVEREQAPPRPGELGGADVLTALAGSGGLVAAVKVLPEFIRSRRSSFHIEATVKGERFVLDATNSEADLERIVERLLSD